MAAHSEGDERPRHFVVIEEKATRQRIADIHLLICPNTPSGRLEAQRAVRTWLLDCVFDFNHEDAGRFWIAIGARRFGEGFDCRPARGSP